MHRFIKAGLVVVVFSALSVVASAAIIVPNPGFESNTTIGDGSNGTTDNWTLSKTGSVLYNSPDLYSNSPALAGNTTVPQRGTYYVRTYYGGGATGTTTISQVLTGQAVLASTTYVLSVDIAALSGGTQTRSLPPIVAIRLKDVSSGLELPGGSLSSPTATPDHLTTWTMTYTTGAIVAGGDLKIELFTEKDTGTVATVDQFVGFDNVGITATPITVPEPASMTLLSAATLIALRRRRHKSRV